MKRYTLTTNKRRRTYTIRRYDDGRLTAKYRSYPQGADYSEDWTEHDIIMFLRHSNDYYQIR